MASTTAKSLLARRYAAAFLGAAEAAHAAQAIAGDAHALQAAMANDKKLAQIFSDPTLSRRALSAVMRSLAQKNNFHALTGNFLALLARSGRLAIITDILEALQKEIDRKAGLQNARLVSATPLSAPQIQQLQEALAAQLKTKVKVTSEVNPDLLGGVQIALESWLIDASVAGKLNRLARQLKNAA